MWRLIRSTVFANRIFPSKQNKTDKIDSTPKLVHQYTRINKQRRVPCFEDLPSECLLKWFYFYQEWRFSSFYSYIKRGEFSYYIPNSTKLLILYHIYVLLIYPAGIWCQNDVVSTSVRRNHVASTLIRRHFRIKCPLGIYNP